MAWNAHPTIERSPQQPAEKYGSRAQARRSKGNAAKTGEMKRC